MLQAHAEQIRKITHVFMLSPFLGIYFKDKMVKYKIYAYDIKWQKVKTT